MKRKDEIWEFWNGKVDGESSQDFFMGKRKRCIGNRLDRQNILQILSKIINQILTDISNSLSYFNTKDVDLGLHTGGVWQRRLG